VACALPCPCEGGSCALVGSLLVCACLSHRAGSRCQYACEANCSGQGRCQTDSSGEGAECECNLDYVGAVCDLPCPTTTTTATAGNSSDSNSSDSNSSSAVLPEAWCGGRGTCFLGYGTGGGEEARCACDLGWTGGLCINEAVTTLQHHCNTTVTLM
jgi:hypothetical protein